MTCGNIKRIFGRKGFVALKEQAHDIEGAEN